MGILDDAIREHLELKRQHGAGSDDLERLENEAFGPATRPGDPDFVGAEAPPEAEAPSSGSTSDWLAGGEDATTLAPEREGREPIPPAEVARTEHAGLGDTADHPAPEPPPELVEPPVEAMAEPEAPPLEEPLPPEEPAGSEPPEPPESSIFDAGDIDFGDLSLELEEDDDGTIGPQPSAAEPNPFVTEEEDLSLAFEDEVPPTGEAALPPREDVLRDSAVEEDTGSAPIPVAPREEDHDLGSEEPALPAEGSSEDPAPPADGDPAGEDLLEETPDFLRDTPEGDRAWFEQDPPKDFDFDD